VLVNEHISIQRYLLALQEVGVFSPEFHAPSIGLAAYENQQMQSKQSRKIVWAQTVSFPTGRKNSNTD
jgi:hypothetical protein